MPTPTFEVKKVKNFMGMDCPGYNCDLYCDGKLIAHVMNDGSGGETRFTYMENGKEVFRESATQQQFEAYCKSLPPLSFEDGEPMTMDPELFVAELLEKFGAEKKVKRDCSKHVCFKLPNDGEGQFRTLKNTPFNEASKVVVLRKYPEAVFLNEALIAGNWYELILRKPTK